MTVWFGVNNNCADEGEKKRFLYRKLIKKIMVCHVALRARLENAKKLRLFCRLDDFLAVNRMRSVLKISQTLD